MRLQTKRARVRGAFTLMEILVVMAILVVLAGAAVPIFMRYLDEAKVNRAKIDVQTISKTLETYNVSHGSLPASLDVLLAPTDGTKPYLEQKDLMDPWNHPYQYDGPEAVTASGKPIVWSHGPRMGDPNSKISSAQAVNAGQ